MGWWDWSPLKALHQSLKRLLHIATIPVAVGVLLAGWGSFMVIGAPTDQKLE